MFAFALGTVEGSIWALLSVAEAVLLLRLIHTGLYRPYRYFTLYLLSELLRSLVATSLEFDSLAYMIAYAAFLPIVCGLIILSCIELYGLVLKDYAGIRTMSNRALHISLAFAVIVSVAMLYADFLNAEGQATVVLAVFAVERALFSTLLFFLVLATAYVVWFPVPLSRNAVTHTLLLAVFFSTQSLLLLFRNLGGVETTRLLSSISLGIEFLCVIGWISLLTRRGEEARVVFGHQWSLEDADRLVGQLDSINATLLKTARK